MVRHHHHDSSQLTMALFGGGAAGGPDRGLQQPGNQGLALQERGQREWESPNQGERAPLFHPSAGLLWQRLHPLTPHKDKLSDKEIYNSL